MDVDPRQYESIPIKDTDIHAVVLSYLVHNCFKETLESFTSCTGMKQPSGCLEDMEKRKRIFHFALEGNVLKAIELTEELAPDLLEKNKDLHFDLLSLHFVELVCAKRCTEALEFAQSKLAPFGKVQKYVEKLEDVMALLAYEEPEKSPMFHLLGLDYRQQVSDSLNRAILANSNLPSYSAMERLIQQTIVVRQLLSQDHGKELEPPMGADEKSFMQQDPKEDVPVDSSVVAEHVQHEEEVSSTLVSNGSVDICGRIADKRFTGGWRASPFIIVNEVAERLAFFAIAVNMVTYLVLEMREPIPTAVTHVTDWIGAAFVLTLLGAFLADAYLGRFKTIIVFSLIYAVGMVLLTVSATVDSLRPPPCQAKPCPGASNGQSSFLYVALALIALGTGGIKPCVSSFGADQFDETDQKEGIQKFSFFNWFFFAINTGALLGITLLVYVQVKKGWGWGFGIPTVAMVCSVFILVAGVKFYRFQKPMGSPFTRFLQVMVASLRNHFKGVKVKRETSLYEVETEESDIYGARKLSHSSQYRFFDKAAVITDPESTHGSRWKICTVTQVEEFKSFVRVLPVWVSTIALSISFAQLSTFFITQARLMDRKLGPHFEVPAPSVPLFSAINGLILIPIYEKFVVPILRRYTGHRRGISSLQRMGIGLFVSIFAMVSAALVEKKRREHYPVQFTMSFFWLLPQCFLIGTAEVFTYVGQLEFFYNEATDGTRSINSAMFLSEIGIGSWLSTSIVKSIERATGGQERGWLRNDLNKSRLDRFYWVLAQINAVNFILYLLMAYSYKGRADVGSLILDVDQSNGSDLHDNDDGGEADAGELSVAF